MTDDIAFLRGARSRGERGRWSSWRSGTDGSRFPVAQATGRQVVGIDTSRAMLGQARRPGCPRRAGPRPRGGRHERLRAAEPAALIYCPFRALLHCHVTDRRRTFERVAASLGRAADRLERVAFDHSIAARLDAVSHTPLPQHQPVLSSVTTGSTWSSTTARRARVVGDGRRVASDFSTSPSWTSQRSTVAPHEPFDDNSREYVFVPAVDHLRHRARHSAEVSGLPHRDDGFCVGRLEDSRTVTSIGNAAQ